MTLYVKLSINIFSWLHHNLFHTIPYYGTTWIRALQIFHNGSLQTNKIMSNLGTWLKLVIPPPHTPSEVVPMITQLGPPTGP